LCLATLPLDCPLIENKKPFHFFFLGTSIDQVTLRHAYYTQNTFMLLYIYIIQCMHIEDGEKKGIWNEKLDLFFLQLLSTKYYFLDSNFRVSENKIKMEAMASSVRQFFPSRQYLTRNYIRERGLERFNMTSTASTRIYTRKVVEGGEKIGQKI
jgi:hypothetical protein